MWVKGQCGNPNGRPKGAYISVCREWAEKGGWQELIAIARNSKDGIRLEAIKVLLAYGYGKPTEKLQYINENQNQIDLTRDVALKVVNGN